MTPDLFTHAAARYPYQPGFKEQGGTSQEAAEKTDAKRLQRLVLEALKAGPATPDQVAERLGLSVLSVRPRLSELVKTGAVEKTKERRRNASGSSAAVLRVVRHG